MKRLVMIAACLLAFAPVHWMAAQTAGPSASVGSLGWLAGSWQFLRGAAAFEEHWTRPAGGTMIGMARVVSMAPVPSKQRTVSFEYLRIVERDGTLIYIAQPQGRPPTEFKLVEATDGRLVFENPAHDFPTRILYRRNSDGSVTARIEGPGGKKAVDFPFQKHDR